MQSLDVISINLWQFLISIGNLLVLFLILKKFLFKPVKAVLAKRKEEIDSQYDAAKIAEQTANENKKIWEQKRAGAQSEADEILKSAVSNADYRSDKIISDAKERADGIIRQAQNDAVLERKKATDDIKKEIVEVSTALAEKMLDREINKDDHRELIDSFIEKIGEGK